MRSLRLRCLNRPRRRDRRPALSKNLLDDTVMQLASGRAPIRRGDYASRDAGLTPYQPTDDRQVPSVLPQFAGV